MAVAFLLGLSLSSCDDLGQDEFNEDVAYLVCEINRQCGGEISGGVLDSLPDDFRCEDDLQTRFNSCGAQCQYREGSARRCLRKLEKTLDDCETRNLRPCRRAYHGCPDSDSCNVWNCAVAPTNSPRGALFALGLTLLGLLRRGRRGVSQSGGLPR